MDDELADCPEAVLTFWRDFAAHSGSPAHSRHEFEPASATVRVIETYGITIPFASTEALTEYWEHGKGAARIRWGTDGAMKRCIREVKRHTNMLDPGGYCATRHKHVTGEWPTTHGEKGIPS